MAQRATKRHLWKLEINMAKTGVNFKHLSLFDENEEHPWNFLFLIKQNQKTAVTGGISLDPLLRLSLRPKWRRSEPEAH